MSWPAGVKLVEVGPRDGLQNEPIHVSTNVKVRLVEALANSGLAHIECGSFVSPISVPAMADSAEVFGAIKRRDGISYSALVPNLKGLERASECNVSEVAVFASASESFSERNVRSSIASSLERYKQVCRAASVPVRGYVSCVVACPYEGPIKPEAVFRVAERLLAMGCYEISLGDTIGVGTPRHVTELLTYLLRKIPVFNLAVHFHDTWGQSLANILVALQMGIAVVDSSVAGLGGCPYAPGATGNVATEDVVYMLNGMNIKTGVDLSKVAGAGWDICRAVNRSPSSKAATALQGEGLT